MMVFLPHQKTYVYIALLGLIISIGANFRIDVILTVAVFIFILLIQFFYKIRLSKLLISLLIFFISFIPLSYPIINQESSMSWHIFTLGMSDAQNHRLDIEQKQIIPFHTDYSVIVLNQFYDMSKNESLHLERHERLKDYFENKGYLSGQRFDRNYMYDPLWHIDTANYTQLSTEVFTKISFQNLPFILKRYKNAVFNNIERSYLPKINKIFRSSEMLTNTLLFIQKTILSYSKILFLVFIFGFFCAFLNFRELYPLYFSFFYFSFFQSFLYQERHIFYLEPIGLLLILLSFVNIYRFLTIKIMAKPTC